MRRPDRKWLIIGCFVIVLGTYVSAAVWRTRSALVEARRRVQLGDWEPARARLEPLARGWPRWNRDEVDFLLGLADRGLGRLDEGLSALRRVDPSSEFGRRAAVVAADILLGTGRLREAEDRLHAVLDRGGPGLVEVRRWLARLYRMEARFVEAAKLLRDGLSDSADPVKILREVWVSDRGTVSLDLLKSSLDLAERLDPNDDRMQLGRARAALLEGRTEEAEARLARIDASRWDEPVARTALEAARASGDVARVVERLRSGGVTFAPGEMMAWRAWVCARLGRSVDEASALEAVLLEKPRDGEALDRLASLRLAAGDVAGATELRRRKAEVDVALDRYRRAMTEGDRFARPAERLAMGELAAQAGRPDDARGWFGLARRDDPVAADLALARLEPARSLIDPRSAFSDLLPPRREPLVPEPLPTTSSVHFRDVASTAGLAFTYRSGVEPLPQAPRIMASGVGVIDYDGDGWLDVYVVQGGAFPPEPSARSGDRLFRNKGDGQFEDASEPAGIARLSGGFGFGVTVGDYDNDGRPDLFLTRWRAYALFRNQGDGTFEDVTERAGLTGDRDWPSSAAFADLDGDGDLDLYVCHYLAWDPSNPRLCRDGSSGKYIYCNPRDSAALSDHVFRNDGGRFVDVTRDAGCLETEGRGLGVVAADLDDDGKVDLFVANDESANFLWHNLGGFRFEEVGVASGVAANVGGGFQAGMGVACGDLDGDGRPDLAVTNFHGESTSFFHNLGGGQFSDRTAAVGLAGPSRFRLGFGISFLDANDDGSLDLITANGHLNDFGDTPYKMPLQLFLGTGRGTLRDVTGLSGPALSVPRLGRALAVADLDNDGKLDVLVTDLDGPLAYLRNESPGRLRSLTLGLEGTTSNRDAVGAKVTVKAGGRTQVAQRLGGGSYQSAGDARLHFGIGQSDRVESIEVRWPSGHVDRYEGVDSEAGYVLREGETRARPLRGFANKRAR